MLFCPYHDIKIWCPRKPVCLAIDIKTSKDPDSPWDITSVTLNKQKEKALIFQGFTLKGNLKTFWTFLSQEFLYFWCSLVFRKLDGFARRQKRKQVCFCHKSHFEDLYICVKKLMRRKRQSEKWPWKQKGRSRALAFLFRFPWEYCCYFCSRIAMSVESAQVPFHFRYFCQF